MYAKLKKGSQYKAYFSGIASTYDNKQHLWLHRMHI